MLQIGMERSAVHAQGDVVRDLAMEHAGFARQILLCPHGGVVACEDALRLEEIDQGFDDFRRCAVHPLIQRLECEVVAVTVDDQCGKKIAFRVDQAISIGSGHVALAKLHCSGECGAPIQRIGQAPQRDLRGRTIVCLAKRPIALVDDLDDIAGLRLSGVEDVAPKDPRMAARNAGGGFAIDADSR